MLDQKAILRNGSWLHNYSFRSTNESHFSNLFQVHQAHDSLLYAKLKVLRAGWWNIWLRTCAGMLALHKVLQLSVVLIGASLRLLTVPKQLTAQIFHLHTLNRFGKVSCTLYVFMTSAAVKCIFSQIHTHIKGASFLYEKPEKGYQN